MTLSKMQADRERVAGIKVMKIKMFLYLVGYEYIRFFYSI